ncbi:MAG TPA: ABC transporter substrate-binding protein, partial [Methanothrix soehngenii]|nr:ABC transporter substrate-binding protein [Methanothrix soehngenii]
MKGCLIAVMMLCGLLAQASAGDYILHIYGNANMDGTIDEKDIEYLQEIIAGSVNASPMADADFDGKVDENDISQVEMIINDSQENITILDGNGKPVTVRLPVERAIVEHLDNS